MANHVNTSGITDDDIRKYYHDPNLNGNEAAEALGMSEPTLIKLARKRGIPTRAELGISGKAKRYTKEQIITALKSNNSVLDAARELRIDPRSLQRLIVRHHLEALRPKSSRGGRRAYWDCEKCIHLVDCKRQPYAFKLPCEKEGTEHHPAR